MAIKKYILTIEYDDSEDSCEYIQEEIVDCSPESRTIYEATVDDYFIVNELRALKETRTELNRQINEKQLEVMKMIGDKEILVSSEGYHLATWKKSKDSNYFDAKQLEKENPSIYNKYLKQRDGSRRFVLKKMEE